MRSIRLILSSSLLLALIACGDDDDDDGQGLPDAAAGADAAETDAGAAPACGEFDAPAATVDSVPGTFTGDTAGAGANLQVAAGVCTDERTFFSQAGEDQVVELTGLTAGTEYVVRVRSAADLAFYVASGCTQAAGGPGTGECALFVDEALGREFGEFTAEATSAFVVVDQFGTDPVADATYTLDVYEPECAGDTDCQAVEASNCFERLCVGCVDSFDCADAATPVCSADNECVAGPAMCEGDDEGENGDDGPAGATPLATPTADTPTQVTASICSAPADELDFYSFTVTEGESRALLLDWTGDADLDLFLYDAEGQFLDAALLAHPEALRTDELAAGTYLVSVQQFDPTDATAVTAYTLSLSIPECDDSFDCLDAGEPLCNAAGTCVAGPAACTGDDADAEAGGGDDGPAGATDVTPAVDAMTVTEANICNSPATESDFYAVTVDAGDNLAITLDWAAAMVDLDLLAFDATGALTGLTFWRKPESVTLTNLPAGVHYLQVTKFGVAAPAAVAYTLTVARAAGGCTGVADCAAEHETQLFRGECGGDGACTFIDGAGAIANGAPCDSADDCESARCSYIAFESDAASSVCTIACADDAACTAELGEGYACTTPFGTNTCHPTCTEDTDCGANVQSGMLDPDLPWDYLTCNAGACDL